MIGFRNFRRKIFRNEDGTTIVEFGMIIVPFAVILMGAFDLGYQMYIRSVLEGTLAEVARKTSVENPSFNGTGATIEDKIAEEMNKRLKHIANNAVVAVDIKNYSEFSEIGKPEKLTTDVNGNGSFDESDGDCWQDLNENGLYDSVTGRNGIGGASDVIYYQVSLTKPRLFPMAGLVGASKNYEISAETLFRSQPYSVQNAPIIECGEPVP
ncbi:TadE/TadG family type IV pilus assembly protein [Parasphingorhabdus halotolerans]|uniref:Pilus assembly protein n=1 Tax=Parasphingorhabdus halotolerans TaxID=2725558 RepID=A0A6H2DI91_9SPHN|nr:TadE/TadG family type IV pilus assembly protein [Parasphingorhabdus halotolerans]QJB67908.1 pilus assembly protein [Parasphingorhabdus halotolerans]